jgi:hypothetical protein
VPATGLITKPDELARSVWIEWTTFKPDSGSEKLLLERINSLGYILEQVSDPVLRLGLYDDLEHEAQHSSKRLGFVFGLPPGTYKSNLCDYQPRSFRTLLRKQRNIPLPSGLRPGICFQPISRSRLAAQGAFTARTYSFLSIPRISAFL